MENGEVICTRQFDEVAISEIVSYKKCVDNLLLKLIPQDRQRNDDDLRVISISSSEAIGKTTLARSVYGRLDVKRWFAYRAWICVQDNSCVTDVLANILRQISTSELKDVDLADEIELSGRLHAYFIKQRYLVVLDNISSVHLTVKHLSFLLDSRNGSKVIITTRNVELPYLIDPWVDPVEFPSLTKEDREQLLLPWLKESEAQARLHHMEETLSLCSFSPGGIRLLEGLLSVTLENENGQFEAMVGDLTKNPSLVDVVSLCYEVLTDSLKRCIMYVCQFPREYEIPTRRLLRLWLAEGFLWSEEPMLASNRGCFPRTDIPMLSSNSGIQDAEEIFQELVRRNMMHVVSRRKGHGLAKTCRMPGFIYDFLLRKALETRFLETYSDYSSTNIPNGEPKFVAERIVLDKARIIRRPGGSSETQDNVKPVCSLISFNTRKIRMQKGELDIFLNLGPEREQSKLKVLDLEGVYKPVLPKDLGKVLLNLKYLGLRWTIIHELPKSIGDLPCLETLDVKHTNITEAPTSIWTKKSLRHLYLNEMNMGKSIPHRGRLPMVNNLQTLCGLRFETNSPMLDELSKLTQIRKLSLTCPSTAVKNVINRIKELTTLHSLRLKSKDLLGLPSKLPLENMNGFLSLSNLYLFGDLEGNNLSLLPKNMKSLTLSMSFLTTDIMKVLGTLQCLTDLRLFAFSFDGKTLKCAGGTFPQLRILKLWKQGNLESLIIEENAMPWLEELDIRECRELREIQGLEFRKKLKEVSLAMVREEVMESLETSLGRSIIITREYIASATAKEVK